MKSSSFIVVSCLTLAGAVGVGGPAAHADPVERPSAAAPRQPAAQEAVVAEGTEGLVAILRDAMRELTHLREELAALKRRNTELEAAQAGDRMALAVLLDELDRANAQAAALRHEVELGWRWIDELNTLLAQVQAEQAAEQTLAAAPRGGADGPSAEVEGDAADAVATAAPGAAVRDRPEGRADAPAGGAWAAEAAYYATTAVNLRDGPGNAADVVTVVNEGHAVQVLGRDGNWLEVAYTDPLARAFTGWIHGRFLSPAEPPVHDAGTEPSRGES